METVWHYCFLQMKPQFVQFISVVSLQSSNDCIQTLVFHLKFMISLQVFFAIRQLLFI